jgi:hypothetical protein
VWDAQAGTALFDLKGHATAVRRVAFTPDGTRIVTREQDGTAKLWDARTGKELEGEAIPDAAHLEFGRQQWTSPDGQLLAQVRARPHDDRVQIVFWKLDDEELAYRRARMEPNPSRYRAEYRAARAAQDDFAAEFYLNLLAPPEQTPIRSESIVEPLFARLLIREDVLAALQAQPAADPEVQAACLKLAGAWFESALPCNNAAWSLVRDPGQPDASYQRGLRLAEEACRIEPENNAFLNTLGVARYRCGLMAEALALLTRSNDFNRQSEPTDLAFLALAQHRLGQSEKARTTLGRLREVIKGRTLARDPEAQAVLHEAETIELDRVFPADPFAP